MPWKYTDEDYREYTRTTWNESAGPYVGLMRTLEPFRAEVVKRLRARHGERILDMGTGPGEPAMTLAREVGPMGHVTGVDLSETMIALAQEKARATGVPNVDFRTMDCSALTLPDSSFDAATCCFGFQIFTGPEAAAREAHRVLKPGGRIGVCVWSTGDKVPLLHALVEPMMELAEPDETGYMPTPYETGGPGEMIRFLAAAGFEAGAESRVQRSVTFRSPDEYLELVLKGTPLGHSLVEEEPKIQQEILRKTRANLERWTSPAGVSLPAECVVVSARK